MKTFSCNNCGNQVRRPSMPLRCESCGQARVGLFRLATANPTTSPQQPAQAPAPGSPTTGSGGGQIIAPPPPPGGGVTPRPAIGTGGATPSNPVNPPAAPTLPATPSGLPQPPQPVSPAPTYPPAAPAGNPSTPPPVTPTPAPVTPTPVTATEGVSSSAPSSSPGSVDHVGGTASGSVPSAPPPPGAQAPVQATPPSPVQAASPNLPQQASRPAPPQRANEETNSPSVADTSPPKSKPSPPKSKPSRPAPKQQPPKSDFTSPPHGRSNTASSPPSGNVAKSKSTPKSVAPKKEKQKQKQRSKPSDKFRNEESAASPAAPVSSAKESPVPNSSQPGRIVWTYPRLVPGQDLDLQPQRGCPAIDSNRQIIATLGRRLVALTEHEDEPRELWDYPARGHIPASPTVGHDGNIRIHSGDGMLHCVGPDGSQVWSTKVGEPLGWAAPLIDNEGHTLVCAYSGGLLKLDAKGTRSNQDFFRSRQKLDSTGVIHHGVLYIGGEDAFVYAIRLAGSRGRNEWNQEKAQGKTEWFINTGIAYHDGLFVVAGRDEYLYGFDEKGLQIWRVHLRGQMLGSPVIDLNGNIYVGVSLERRGEESSGTLVCIAGSSHQVRWEYEAGTAIESTPVIGEDGVLYFGDNNGAVHAIDLDGQRQWVQNVGSPVRSAGVITPSKHVLFGTDRGTLVALAGSSAGIAKGGWPKLLGTLEQAGTTGRR